MKVSAASAVAIFAIVALGASAVLAEQNPIEARQALMKANGKAAKAGAAMIKGEAPYDAAKVKEIFATFENAAAKMPDLFPPDSKTGHDTTASPKIWENMADVKARFKKLGEDSKAAAAKVTDVASLKAAFGSIGKDCGGCHHEYRIKKN